MMAMRCSKKDTARGLAVDCARIAEGDNAEDIVVLDLRGISPVADYFVIATGSSGRQMRTVADEMAAHGKAMGQPAWHKAGHETGDWIVLDFVDVVVHLFDTEKRAYYDLDLIWGEAPKVDWQDAKLSQHSTQARQAENPAGEA